LSQEPEPMSIDAKQAVFQFLDNQELPPEDKTVRATICAGGKVFNAYHIGIADQGLLIHFQEKVEIKINPSFKGKYATPFQAIDTKAFIPYQAISYITAPNKLPEGAPEPRPQISE
jgi:hypothetical protein